VEMNLGLAMLLTNLVELSTDIGNAIAYLIRTPMHSHPGVML
jgi:hypothetical protein